MTPPQAPTPGDEPGVLAGLSRTRPQRRSAKRPGRPQPGSETAATPEAAADATTPAPVPASKAAAKPKASAKKAAAKTKAAAPKAAAKPRTAAKPKAAAKPAATVASSSARTGTAQPTTAAPAAGGKARSAARDTAKEPAVEVGRRAPTTPARPETPPAGRQPEPVSGTELLAQAIHAADEVARFGVGIARSVLSRLPRP